MFNRLFGILIVLTSLALSIDVSATTVAIIKGDFYTTNLKDELVTKGLTVSEITSYTTGSLSGYDSVIQYGNDFLNQAALIDYVMKGGTLIETPWFWLNNSPETQLDIFSHGGSAQFSVTFPGVIVTDPTSSLVSGVTFPIAGTVSIGRTFGNGFTAGVMQIASYVDGTAFIGEKELGLGKVIGINLQVITSDTRYDIVNQSFASHLLANAAVSGEVPEPTTMALLGLGLLGIGASCRKSAKNKNA
jgi:hypothetical protein